ncbi:hypothetical protein ACFL7D_03070 [candidate division KSB1 bacterium]
MKRKIAGFTVLILIIVFSSSFVSAQGFTTILKKIEEIEARLKKLESGAGVTVDLGGIENRLGVIDEKNKTNFETLQNKLTELEKGLDPANTVALISAKLEDLAARFEVLAKELEELRTAGKQEEEEEFLQIAADLRDEISDLRTTLEEPQVEEEAGGEGPVFLGFFDINAGDFTERENPWAIGPFELDLEYAYGENFAGAGAFVFEDGAADVGVAFIDYHQYDTNIAARGRIFYEPGFHVQVGAFDIPFGLDYLFYATPDRQTITGPLTTDFIFDGGWGDIGMRFYGTHNYLDISVFAVNGFDPGYAAGGRLGFSPLRDPFRMHRESPTDVIQLGVSYAVDLSPTNEKETTVLGFDVESVTELYEVRGEYLKKENVLDNTEITGFYGLLKVNIPTYPLYATINYDLIKPDENLKVKRMLFGLTYEIAEYSVLKFEISNFIDDNFFELDEELNKKVFSTKLVLSF